MIWATHCRLLLPLALAAPWDQVEHELLNTSWVKEVEGEEANAVQQIMSKPDSGAVSATEDFAWNGASLAVAVALVVFPICFLELGRASGI